jgi:hypothetical protein
MDPDEIKIPVPMRDAQSIYAALGSLRRIAAIEANDASKGSAGLLVRGI